jgi:hypothetical protein
VFIAKMAAIRRRMGLPASEAAGLVARDIGGQEFAAKNLGPRIFQGSPGTGPNFALGNDGESR